MVCESHTFLVAGSALGAVLLYAACCLLPDACSTPYVCLWRVARLHALQCMVNAAQDASRGLNGMAHIVHVVLRCMRILCGECCAWHPLE